MRIITLNVWGGFINQPLLNFLEKNKDIDIFLLQEVDHNGDMFEEVFSVGNDDFVTDKKLFNKISGILDGHHGYFSPQLGEHWGIAIFVKKDIYKKVSEYGELIISNKQEKYWEYKTWFRRTIQWLDFSSNSTNYTLVNIHGLWEPGRGKNDSESRIEQSKNIINFLNKKRDRKIIFAGDFNLNPETESIKMIDTFGLINLIKSYGITNTRTSFYKKDGKFADYVFVSPEVEVKEFKILPDEVSDHAAIYLEIC